jgi:hypothetical protein
MIVYLRDALILDILGKKRVKKVYKNLCLTCVNLTFLLFEEFIDYIGTQEIYYYIIKPD